MKLSNLTRLKQVEQITHGEVVLVQVVYEAGPGGEPPETLGPVYRYLVPPDGRPVRGDDDAS